MFRAMRSRAAAFAAAGAFALGAEDANCLAAVSAAGQAPPAPQPPAAQGRSGPRVNAEAALAAEFTKRVQEYVALHKKASEGLPRLSKEATPEAIDKYQRTLGQAIQNVRPKAQAGDIFTREIRAYFRRRLEGAFAGPEGRKLKASIMDENPGPIRLQVNGRYPDNVPLSTMPPQVLSALPKLPPEMEYRFIGDRLILLDVAAHLVVDYVEGALPK